MKEFMGNDFLLNTETAKKLYHNYAAKMPIYDYHCHLSPKEIYENKEFKNLTEAWLGGDHYKWRALRAYGVDEAYITGDKSDYEKFLKWAEVVPYTIGNPLYHWTHLELRRYFGIDTLLSPDTAEQIWNQANAKLKTLTARELIAMSNVKTVCTTDDPIDNLEYHMLIAKDSSLSTRVLPAFRPDKAVNIELSWYNEWVDKLASVVKFPIISLEDLKQALVNRIDFFHTVGCRLSDHALDVVLYSEATDEEVEVIFQKARNGESISKYELKKYKGHMMVFFGKEYAKRGWTQQYHIGALRNNSQRMLRELGPDTGFDAINDTIIAQDLSRLLDALDDTDALPKTILYTLNPRDNEVLAAMIGCFQGSGVKGKMQFGSGWWFNDQLDGMARQMEALSQLGLISNFVGMLTDSRSFLSYPRHEYFRRLLCDRFGALIESGQYPNNVEFVGKVVEDICYNNAVNYFNMS